jgi:hypothetical protein
VDLRATYSVSPQRVIRVNVAGRSQDSYRQGSGNLQSETTLGSVEVSGALAPGLTFTGLLVGSGDSSLKETQTTRESYDKTETTGSLEIRTNRLKRGTASAKTEITQTVTDGTSYTPVLKGQGRVDMQISPLLTGTMEVSVGAPIGEAALAKDIRSQQSVFGQLGMVTINASRLSAGYRIANYAYVSSQNDRIESSATASWSYSPRSYLTLTGEYQLGLIDMHSQPSQQETSSLSANILYRPLPEFNVTFTVMRQDVDRTDNPNPATHLVEDSYALKGEYQFYAVKFVAEAQFANTAYSQDTWVDKPEGRRYVIRLGAERYF